MFLIDGRGLVIIYDNVIKAFDIIIKLYDKSNLTTLLEVKENIHGVIIMVS